MTTPENGGAAAAEQVVLGADIGTTSTKVVAFDTAGRELASHGIGYDLHEPSPGRAEQDPDEIVAAVLGCLRAVVADLGDRPVAGVSFSSAMHSLIGLDHDGKPLTPSITWADSRASEQAERLRAEPAGLALHRRTGTPIHPMSPLAKLIWFKEQEPHLHRQVGHWAGIKDYVLMTLCEALVTDHSLASGTGLMDIHRRVWDDEALRRAGVLPEQLPELVATTSVRTVAASAAAASGLPAGTPVVVGAGDGPLANLGLGAVRPGVAACSIGTSGALRVMVEDPGVDPLGGVFCYALTEDRWVVGGAINNGGVVLQWTGEALAPDLGTDRPEELLELAAAVPVGSGGLIMLPYLLSERAPHWSALPRGAYIGLTHEHRRGHLIRAALEGVCQQLALVLESMRAAGNEIREIRATGGFARSPLWRQMLADTLGMPVHFPAGHEGSSFGAALLGMQALGLIGSIEVAAELVTIDDVVRPDARAAAVYRSLQPVFAELYGALVPAYTSLRRLAPALPLEHPSGPGARPPGPPPAPAAPPGTPEPAAAPPGTPEPAAAPETAAPETAAPETAAPETAAETRPPPTEPSSLA